LEKNNQCNTEIYRLKAGFYQLAKGNYSFFGLSELRFKIKVISKRSRIQKINVIKIGKKLPGSPFMKIAVGPSSSPIMLIAPFFLGSRSGDRIPKMTIELIIKNMELIINDMMVNVRFNSNLL
jgi:hypothetical protein